jgi:hypothetical protein
MGKVLSHKLLDDGWVMAFGGNDLSRNGHRAVWARQPLSWDHNMGVMAIYDELGRPWVRPANLGRYMHDLINEYRLERGAYVPYSNDGGFFLNGVWPGLVDYRRTSSGVQPHYDAAQKRVVLPDPVADADAPLDPDEPFNRAMRDYTHHGPHYTGPDRTKG